MTMKLLNTQQTAHLLNVSKSQVKNWAHAQVLPHVRLGPRLLRFRPEDLEVFLQQRRVIPNNEGGDQR